MKLNISKNLALPLDWITMATVVYGARGSGKTTLGSVFAEEVVCARQRFCAIDLKGDWFGLKSSADGKSDGIPAVIFGGDHKDVPLEAEAGAFVGETVAELGQSCILDLEHLSKGKRIRFLADFFEALYHRNREPLLLLMDESQSYAPQVARNQMVPEIARCLGAVEDIVKLGRKHGIGPVLFTQRGAGLNKEVSELCDMLVAFRTPGPLDQDRIKDWLDANTTKAQRDEVMSQLSGLATGTAIFASGHPDLKIFGVVPVRRRETFDSSATPKVGQRRVEPKRLAKPALEELERKMADAIERAKADDPKALRAEIAKLKREAGSQQVNAELQAEIQRLVENVRTLQHVIPATAQLIEKLEKIRDSLDGAINVFMVTQARAATVKLPPAIQPPPKETFKQKTEPHRAPQTNGKGLDLPKAQREVLLAVASRHPKPTSKHQAALLSGYSVTSGHFANILSGLRKGGWVQGGGDELRVTSEAWPKVESYVEPALEGNALLERWTHHSVVGSARALLEVLFVHPKGLTREELGEATGYSGTSGHFANMLSKLRRLELIERGEPIKLSEAFFS